MNESTLNRMIREHKARIIWFLVFLILAVFVTALVFGTLKRSVQAQTYTKRVFACPYAQEGAEPVAHQHNDDCYENGELICTLPERELHTHGEECYGPEEKVLVCTLEEGEGHVHTDACYTEEPVIVCGLEENNGHVHSVENGCYTRVQGDLICTDEDPEHVHTDDCYTWEEVLTCEIPEGEGAHHHSEECYEIQRVLSCGKEEGEGAHTHDDTCYEIQKVLICNKEEVKTEHVHTVDCFKVVDMSPEEIHAKRLSELPESDPTADVESPDVWESRFASVPLSGHWDRDLLKIAETQLGYTESQRNFDAVLDENGEGYTLKGWTRYGAWYGIPYGDWCAMFISFCLNYADIPESAIPYDCATTTWINSLSERGMYAPAGSYDPKPGDLIFFDWEGDGLSDHVGIVWAVNPSSITTIEGNHTISVELFDYDRYDSHIQGYGILPENPALAVDDSDENPTADQEGANGDEGKSAVGTSETSDINSNGSGNDSQDAAPTVKMPPFSYSERVAGMRVSIEADEGAFPEGTTVTIKPIEDDNLAEQVAPAISGQVVKVQAVDITFYDTDGNEIEPRIPIRVTMRPFTETEADNVGVVHVGNDGVVSAVDTQNDVAQPDQGIAFNADSFSTYALVYTVTFACDADGNVYQYSMPGGTGLSLRELLIDLGMKTEDNVDSYLSHVVNVAFSKPDCMTLTKEGNDWLLQSVHAFDTPESLTVTFDDYSMLAIPVTVSGIEELQLDNASISSADGVFLPEGTEGFANVVEDAAETISAVEDYVEKNTPEPTLLQQLFSSNSKAEENNDKAYQVFDIGLDNVDTDNFTDGFNVEVKLPENVVGKDFHLYHIHDNNVEEIDLKLASTKLGTGSDFVTGFSFQTDSFSTFALSYTVDFAYVDEEGNSHTWSFPGTGSHALTEVLEQLGIEAIEITAADLVRTETVGEYGEKDLYLTQNKETGEWLINSDAAFDDTYLLTVTADGIDYLIVIKDDIIYPVDLEMSNDVLQYIRGNISDKMYIVAEQTTGNVTRYNISSEIDKTKNSKTYQFSIAPGIQINSDSLYLAYNSWNRQDPVSDNSLRNGGKGVYKTIGDYPVSIEVSDYGATITIGEIETDPNSYTVAISGEDLNIADLTGYYLLARKGGTYKYFAPLNNLSTITDIDGTLVSTMTDVKSFEIVKFDGKATLSDLKAISPKLTNNCTVGKPGAYYTIEFPDGPNDSVYTFTASKQPESTKVSITFMNDNGGSLGANADLDACYYLVAGLNGERAFFARVLGTDASLNFMDANGNPVDSLPLGVDYEIVKASGEVTELSALPAESTSSFRSHDGKEYGLNTTGAPFLEAPQYTEYKAILRVLNAEGEAQRPSTEWNYNYKFEIVLNKGGQQYTSSQDLSKPGPDANAVQEKVFTTIDTQRYALGDDVTVKLIREGIEVKNGDVISGYVIGVETLRGVSIYTATPIKPYTVELQLDSTDMNLEAGEKYYIYAGKLIDGQRYWNIGELNFEGGATSASVEFQTIGYPQSGNRKANSVMIDSTAEFYLVKYNSNSFVTGTIGGGNESGDGEILANVKKYSDGTSDGKYTFSFTTNAATRKTTILRSPSNELDYTIKVVEAENDASGNPVISSKPVNLNGQNWYVRATVARNDGNYVYIKKFTANDFSSNQFSNNISVFYNQFDYANSQPRMTAPGTNEFVTFELLRAQDDSAANDSQTAPWKYFSETSVHINTLAPSGSSVANCYTLEVDGNTLLLREAPTAKITVSGIGSDSGHHDLPNYSAGKYYVVGTTTFRDGTEDKTRYYVNELTITGNGDYTIKDGFKSVSEVDPQFLTGTRYYEPCLVFVSNEYVNTYDSTFKYVANAVNSGNAEIYGNNAVLGKYRVTTTGGTLQNPNTTVTLTALPGLSVVRESRGANGALHSFDDEAHKYYVLAELNKGSEKSYAYLPLPGDTDPTKEASDRLRDFVSETGKMFYCAAEDDVTFYVVESDGALNDLSAVKSAARFAEGQLMSVYTPSFERSGDSLKVILSEQKTPTPKAQTVKVEMLDKAQQNLFPEVTSLSENYYVLAWLTPKGTGSSGTPVGWTVLSTNGSQNIKDALKNIGGWQSVIGTDNENNGFYVCDGNMNAVTGRTMGCDPDLYDLNLRLYHTADSVPTTFTKARTGDDTAPAGYDFKGVFNSTNKDPNKGDPNEDNLSIIRLHQAYDKEFAVRVYVNEPGLVIDENEGYSVRVTVTHASDSSTSVATVSPLVIGKDAGGETPVKLTLGEWTGSAVTGNEKSVAVEILYKGNVVAAGESINRYTPSLGSNEIEEFVDTDTPENSKQIVYYVLHFDKDVNGIKIGEINNALSDATNFGLYTEILSKHATDMESNIGADKVTAIIGADYGYSSNNIMVNQLRVTKRFTGAGGAAKVHEPVTLRLYTVDQYDTTTGNYTLLEGYRVSDEGATVYTDENGVVTLDFKKLPAGRYVLKEVIDGQEYSFRSGTNGTVELNGGKTITFADDVLTIENTNINVNYFGSFDQNVYRTSTDYWPILRHVNRSWALIVTEDETDYGNLVTANGNRDNTERNLIAEAGDKNKNAPLYDIPADMENLRNLSRRLAASGSSETVKIMNVTLEQLNGQEALNITGDGRFVVVNVDMSNAGSVATVNVRTRFDGGPFLTADFGHAGNENASKILFNFVSNGEPYTGKINTANEGAGVLLAPAAIVADLGGNWGGTIVCHEAQHTGSEIHSDSQNKIQKINTVLLNSQGRPTTGDLELQKEIQGENADYSTWFTFEVTLKDEGGNVPEDEQHRTFTASGLRSGTSVTFDAEGKATVQVRAKNKVTITGIPNDYTYTVEEKTTAESEHYQLIQIVDAEGNVVNKNAEGRTIATGSIEAQQTDVVTVTNALKVGGLTISKTVLGEPSKQEFNFRVTIMQKGSETDPDANIDGPHGGVNFKDGIAEFTLLNGGSTTIEVSGIPTGRKFKLEETDANNGCVTSVAIEATNGVPSTYSIDGGVVTGTIGDDKNAITIAYTNDYTEDKTTFSFNKIWLGPTGNINSPSDYLIWKTDIEVTIKRRATGSMDEDADFALKYTINTGSGVSYTPLEPGSVLPREEGQLSSLTLTASNPGNKNVFHFALPDNSLVNKNSSGTDWEYYVVEEPITGYAPTKYGSLSEGVGSISEDADFAADNGIILNQTFGGYELPKTGGAGTAVYGLIGGLMVVTAGAALLLRKKKNKA